MKIIYISIILSIVLLAVFSRTISLQDYSKCNWFEAILYKISIYLYQCFRRLQKVNMNNKASKVKSKRHKIEESLMSLNPLREKNKQKQLLEEYNVNKIKTVVLVIFLGVFVGLAIEFGKEPLILDDISAIEKNEYGGGEKQVRLEAKIIETEKTEEVVFILPERVYTRKEIEVLYQDFLNQLKIELMGSNSNLNHINKDLSLAKSIEGYPFLISWTFDQYEFVSDQGVLSEKIPEKGTDLMIIAEISYDTWKTEEVFYCKLFPAKKQELNMSQTIEARLKHMIEMTKEDEYFRLPNQIENQEIIWSETVSYESIYLIIGIIITVILINFAHDYELKEKVTKREEQMMMDYPELVSKLCLFLGAGLTVRSVFYKIGQEYLNKKSKGNAIRFAYEEIAVTCFELEGGVSEMMGYDNFARRCKQNQYLKLGSILSQNLKKGSSKLQEILETEARASFEERKSLAKKRGEEAGTKLLLPMMLMMAVIMIIIMVPAFLTFNL